MRDIIVAGMAAIWAVYVLRERLWPSLCVAITVKTGSWLACRAADATERGAHALRASVCRKGEKCCRTVYLSRLVIKVGVVCRVIGHGFNSCA
jgi:hypothetical protein